jgi:hypothetical protein
LPVLEDAYLHDVSGHLHVAASAHATKLRDARLRFAVDRYPCGVLSGRDDERLM